MLHFLMRKWRSAEQVFFNLKTINMLIYNTTYQTGIDDARNFVIWLSESYIPEVEKGKYTGVKAGRILKRA